MTEEKKSYEQTQQTQLDKEGEVQNTKQKPEAQQEFEKQAEVEDKKESNKSNESDLILGKFKSVEDLKTAYLNLQKHQGAQSEELGKLRKLAQVLSTALSQEGANIQKYNDKVDYINNNLQKYDNENYFKNDAFKNLYQAAFEALGTNLDTDGFIKKLEDYVASRLLLSEQLKNAQDENKLATDGLSFSNGVSKKPEKKIRFQDIPVEDIAKYIAKYV